LSGSVYHGECVSGCVMCDSVNVKSTSFVAVFTGKNGKNTSKNSN